MNNKGLLLIIAINKLNTNKIFSIAFSYVLEEDVESYKEFFDILRDEIFYDIPNFSYVIVDLGTGIIKAYDKLKCLSDLILQYYNFYAIWAMER
jgi:hypothetical protein